MHAARRRKPSERNLNLYKLHTFVGSKTNPMKQILLVFLSIVLLSSVSKAQTVKTIPNGDFENWDSITYNDLDSPWVTQNNQYIAAFGKATVTKVPGKVGSAIHVQTIVAGKDTIPGVAEIQGTPYSQTPTGISGYYRCNVLGYDTAWLLIEFIQGGSLLGLDTIHFTGSDTNAFQSFNSQFSDPLIGVPDSVVIFIASSNIFDYVDITPGSWIEFDQLAFTGSGITQPIPDGGFESWKAQSMDNPIGWQANLAFNPYNITGISKSSDHYSGKYSVKLVAQPNSFIPQMTSGILDQYGNIIGGQPYELASDTLTGYYIYEPSGSDSGGILITLQNSGSVIGMPQYVFEEAPSWTYFQVPISVQTNPDTMRIDIYASSSNFGTSGSTLYLDDLQLKSQPHTAGISFNPKTDFGISAFPDPAQNQLNIRFGGVVPSEFGLKIYNSEGRLMIDNQFNSGNSLITISIDQLSAGLYFYEINTNGSSVRNKFVKSN